MSFIRPAALSRLLSALPVLCGLAMPVAAQEAWPSKPVRLVVPFAAGGSTDVVARMIGQSLSAMWGQPVMVDNRPGAGGNVGADLVAKSPGDGHTLLMASGSITINPHIYARMPFDTKKDLMPITNVASGPMLVVVPDSSAITNIKQLIEAAKAKPGAMNFGSAGMGSQVHLAGENLADAAGINIVHVPYKGEAPAYTDLISNQVQLMVGNFAAASALVGKGRLRALAVTGRERSPQLPDVPTVAEAALPGFENTGWFGLFAPAGTPPAVVEKIRRDTVKVLEQAETKASLYTQGMSPVGNSSADFARQLDDEMVRWAKVVKNRKLAAN